MKDILKKLEEKALAYEQGKMMRSDSEVEIDIFDGDDGNSYVWISDYSEERGGAEGVEKFCLATEIASDDIIKLCDKHGWCYSI